MTDEQVLAEFRAAEALLEGHFILSSGLRSSRYLQCARVLMNPARAARLAEALAFKIPDKLKIQLGAVVAPAMGGVIAGHEVGRALGLDAMDRRYLLMIADVYRGGPVGVETLAAGLGEPRDTIEEVIEPYLIQLALVARTARGRCLTGRAWTHLGLAPPPGAQENLFGPQ